MLVLATLRHAQGDKELCHREPACREAGLSKDVSWDIVKTGDNDYAYLIQQLSC